MGGGHGIAEAVEESRRIVPDEVLRDFDDYPFRLTVHISHVDVPRVLGELERAGGLEPVESTTLTLYTWLRLIGLKHLAYLFQFPKPDPWDDASRKIGEGVRAIPTYPGRDSYAFRGHVLLEPQVRKEIRELGTWLEENGPGGEDFLALAAVEKAVHARRSSMAYGTPIEVYMMTPRSEHPQPSVGRLGIPGLEGEAEHVHGDLLGAARLLEWAAALAEKCLVPPIVELTAYPP